MYRVLTWDSSLHSSCRPVKEAPPVWHVSWAVTQDHSTDITLCFPLAQNRLPPAPGLVSDALSGCQDCPWLDESGFCACSSSVMKRVTPATPPSAATHCCSIHSSPCPGDRAAEGRILGFPHFPLVPTFQDFYTVYKVTLGFVSTAIFSPQLKT